MIIADTRLEGKRKNNELYRIRHEAGEEVAKAGKNNAGAKNKLFRARAETLSADSIMKAITGYDPDSKLWKLWQDIAQSGLRVEQTYKMEAQKLFGDLRANRAADKAYKAASDESKEWDITDSRGEKVKMSELTAAALWMTWQRETHNEGHIHLKEGGALIPDPKLLKKGDRKKAEDNGQFIPKVTPEIIDKIYNGLSAYTRNWIKNAEKYFNEYSAPKINEVSQEVFHRDIATNSHYIPYYVFSDGRVDDVEGMQMDATLESTGGLQELQKNSDKVLTIFSLDRVVDKHISEMSKVTGYMIPIRNFSKVWGGLILAEDMISIDRTLKAGPTGIKRNLKSIVEAHFGEVAVKSVESTLVELGGKKAGLGSLMPSEKLIDTLTGNFSKAIFVGNVRVRMKQITSYYAAGSVLSGGALAHGISANVNNIRYGGLIKGAAAIDEEADKYTALLYARRAGMSLANLGEASSETDWMTRLGAWNPAKWMQSADVNTARRLWVASKYEIAQRYTKAGKQNEIGSQKYFEDVADIFEQAVSATQPYHTLHKAMVMKTDKQLVREFYKFRTQSFLNAGVLYDACAELMATPPRSDARKRAGKKFAKVVASQAAGAIVFVVLDFAASLLLHRMNPWRDDEGELTWESVGVEASSRMISGVAELILPRIGPELYDAITGAIKGTRYDTFSVTAVDTLNDLINIGWNGINLFSDKLTNEQRWDKAIGFVGDLLTGVGSLFGIPVSNIKQIVDAVRYHIEDAVNKEFGSFEAGYDRKGEQQYKRAYDALIDDDTKNNHIYEKAHDQYVQSRSGELKGLSGDKLAEKKKEIEDAWHNGIKKQLKEHNAAELTKAAVDVADGDLSAYLKVVDEYKRKGFDREDIARAIYSMTDKEGEPILSGTPIEGTIYHPRDLYSATGTTLYDQIYDELYDAKLEIKKTNLEKKAKEEGTSVTTEQLDETKEAVDSELHEAIRKELKEEGKIAGTSLDYGTADFSTYKQTISYYVGKGFEEEDVTKAIRSGIDGTEIVKGTVYSKRDLCRAAGTKYQSEIEKEIRAAYKASGLTDEKIRGKIRSAATDYFKPMYMEATGAERTEIKKKITALGCYKDPAGTIYDWYKESLES
jgi:hypothetical protein